MLKRCNNVVVENYWLVPIRSPWPHYPKTSYKFIIQHANYTVCRNTEYGPLFTAILVCTGKGLVDCSKPQYARQIFKTVAECKMLSLLDSLTNNLFMLATLIDSQNDQK